MPIYINGTLASSLVYNGTTITTAYYNATQVLAPVVQTATPTIPSFSYFNAWYINIKNNDAAAADMWAEANDSTPDVFRANVGAGQTYQVIDSSQPSFATFTYYVTAQAAGKTLSNVYSRTIT
jgi:hypothetical protein